MSWTTRRPTSRRCFAAVGAEPPDGSNAEGARSFEAVLDGARIRQDLGFMPTYPRPADALAAES
jgi:UDP-glucose 4-epimerase